VENYSRISPAWYALTVVPAALFYVLVTYGAFACAIACGACAVVAYCTHANKRDEQFYTRHAGARYL